MAINYAMIIVFLRPYPTSRFAPNVPIIMPPTPILVSKGTKSFYSSSSHEKCFVYKVDSSLTHASVIPKEATDKHIQPTRPLRNLSFIGFAVDI